MELTATVRDYGTGDLESDTLTLEPKDMEFRLIALKPGFGEFGQYTIPFLVNNTIDS